jgi:hypothetical protein
MRSFAPSRFLLALGLLTTAVGCDSLTEPNAITIRKEPPRPKAPEPAADAGRGAPAAANAAGAAAAAAPAMPAAPKAGGG